MPVELRTGRWKLADLASVPKNGFKVFSCFCGGGGSSMGYKLAGFDVVGCVEIDPDMMSVYRINHHPRHPFEMPIQKFNEVPDSDLPAELFGIDVLDGSPPCSVFSMSGDREKDWGREREFREGQAKQVLDDLFHHFLVTVGKLKPKVVVAENVKGLIIGNAKWYVKMVFEEFARAGYDVQLFLLNAAKMGVPQARERVFFLARRKDLGFPPIRLEFNERFIGIGEACSWVKDEPGKPARMLTDYMRQWWDKTSPGQSFSKVVPGGSCFSTHKQDPRKPCTTLCASHGGGKPTHWSEPRYFTDWEVRMVQSFPDDYDFLGQDVQYVCGMGVPPFMMQRVANQVALQWLGIKTAGRI